MRAKVKKILFVTFLFITVLMFLHSWQNYVSPVNKADSYANKHHHQLHHKQHTTHSHTTHV